MIEYVISDIICVEYTNKIKRNAEYSGIEVAFDMSFLHFADKAITLKHRDYK